MVTTAQRIRRGAELLILTLLAAGTGGCDRAHSMAGDSVYQIEVPDMVCQGCAGSISEALRGVGGVEEVRVDVASKQVRVGVDSSAIESDSILRDAIVAAGYAPMEKPLE